ncbi:MAG: hypothetical protein H0W72_08390 [Planctomycetes bacterium]|nr:hypothetical protein [Planctomycetota bacterium]
MGADNDLQLQVIAKLGQILPALDRLDEKVLKVERSVAKVSRSGRDFQGEASRGFGGAGNAVTEYDAKLRRTIKTGRDFQQESSRGLLKLKDNFQAFSGIAIAGGGAVTAILTGIAAAARAAAKEIDEARVKTTQLAEGPGAKQGAAAIALSGVNGVDSQSILDTATKSQGTASQDQINDFIRQLVASGVPLDNNNASGAIRRFADVGGVVPDAGERIIAGMQARPFDAANYGGDSGIDQQVGKVDTADPTFLRDLRARRFNETRRIAAGGTAAARTTALSEDIAKTNAEVSAAALNQRYREAGGLGKAGIGLGQAFKVTGRWLGDVLSPGTSAEDNADASAKNQIYGPPPPPLRVVVTNQPTPVDGGF